MSLLDPSPGPRHHADTWVEAADGERYWGRFGAAGLLAYDQQAGSVLLHHRATWSHHGDTWGIPGGARHDDETAWEAALREAHEEAGVPAESVTPQYAYTLDRGGWAYTTIIADVVTPFTPTMNDHEGHALAWVPVADVAGLPLHPGFAASWPTLQRLLGCTPTVIVDAANVVGSVPDGWWRDRRAATDRLRRRIDLHAGSGVGVDARWWGFPVEGAAVVNRVFPQWWLVTEGPTAGLRDTAQVTVTHTSASGDDAVVTLVHHGLTQQRMMLVITSDTALQARVLSAGAISARGAGSFLRQLPPLPPESLQ